MNKKRRQMLDNAIEKIEDAIDIVDQAKTEEQDCIDNMPENLQESERVSKMEDAVDALENAIDSLREAVEQIEEATSEG